MSSVAFAAADPESFPGVSFGAAPEVLNRPKVVVLQPTFGTWQSWTTVFAPAATSTTFWLLVAGVYAVLLTLAFTRYFAALSYQRAQRRESLHRSLAVERVLQLQRVDALEFVFPQDAAASEDSAVPSSSLGMLPLLRRRVGVLGSLAALHSAFIDYAFRHALAPAAMATITAASDDHHPAKAIIGGAKKADVIGGGNGSSTLRLSALALRERVSGLARDTQAGVLARTTKAAADKAKRREEQEERERREAEAAAEAAAAAAEAAEAAAAAEAERKAAEAEEGSKTDAADRDGEHLSVEEAAVASCAPATAPLASLLPVLDVDCPEVVPSARASLTSTASPSLSSSSSKSLTATASASDQSSASPKEKEGGDAAAPALVSPVPAVAAPHVHVAPLPSLPSPMPPRSSPSLSLPVDLISEAVSPLLLTLQHLQPHTFTQLVHSVLTTAANAISNGKGSEVKLSPPGNNSSAAKEEQEGQGFFAELVSQMRQDEVEGRDEGDLSSSLSPRLSSSSLMDAVVFSCVLELESTLLKDLRNKAPLPQATLMMMRRRAVEKVAAASGDAKALHPAGLDLPVWSSKPRTIADGAKATLLLLMAHGFDCHQALRSQWNGGFPETAAKAKASAESSSSRRQASLLPAEVLTAASPVYLPPYMRRTLMRPSAEWKERAAQGEQRLREDRVRSERAAKHQEAADARRKEREERKAREAEERKEAEGKGEGEGEGADDHSDNESESEGGSGEEDKDPSTQLRRLLLHSEQSWQTGLVADLPASVLLVTGESTDPSDLIRASLRCLCLLILQEAAKASAPSCCAPARSSTCRRPSSTSRPRPSHRPPPRKGGSPSRCFSESGSKQGGCDRRYLQWRHPTRFTLLLLPPPPHHLPPRQSPILCGSQPRARAGQPQRLTRPRGSTSCSLLRSRRTRTRTRRKEAWTKRTRSTERKSPEPWRCWISPAQSAVSTAEGALARCSLPSQ